MGMTTQEVLVAVATGKLSRTAASKLLSLPESERQIKPKSKSGRPKGVDSERRSLRDEEDEELDGMLYLLAQLPEGHPNRKVLEDAAVQDYRELHKKRNRVFQFTVAETGKSRRGFRADRSPDSSGEIGYMHAALLADVCEDAKSPESYAYGNDVMDERPYIYGDAPKPVVSLPRSLEHNKTKLNGKAFENAKHVALHPIA
ncbi:MAG: hypothetical protein ACLP9L_10590, partial [Thermoguttaceae bacterium]